MPQNKLSLTVTQVSLNQTALDWPQNTVNHYDAIKIAVDAGSDIVLMPELSATAYEVNDDFQRTDNNRIHDFLMSVAEFAYAADPNLIVSVGHPWRLQLRDLFNNLAPSPSLVKNPLYDRLSLPFNMQTLIGRGRVLGMTAKANLYNDERGYEKRYFSEWDIDAVDYIAKLAGIESTYGTIRIPLRSGDTDLVPTGRPIIHVAGKNGGFLIVQPICEEKWVASKYDGHPRDDSRYEQLNIIPSIARYLGSTEGLMLAIANASPPSRKKQDKHIHLNNLASKYADIVFDTDGLGSSGSTFAQYGHMLVNQNGAVIGAGQRLRFGQLSSMTSTVQIGAAPDSASEKAHGSVLHEFKNEALPVATTLAWEQPDGKAAWDNPEDPDRWKEEAIRDIALWNFDYIRKTKSQGIMEALSGGKDSSFNCAMVSVMVHLAMDDLGVEGFCEQMSHLKYKDQILAAYESGGKAAAIETCMAHMLKAVYMPTGNSSHETWYAAKSLMEGGELADGTKYKGIGGQFIERNVQDLLDFYAYVFAVDDTSKVPDDIKLQMQKDISKFLNASPYEHSVEDMAVWEKELREKYPQIDRLISAAIPEHVVGYENIQARGRSVLVFLFANIEGLMAVANPNLDEAYGAYATFQGDLQGGTINPNAAFHKEDQEALMQYLEDHGMKNVMDRVLALHAANGNRPSAELQPKGSDGQVTQFDEDALQGTFPQKSVLARLRHHTKVLTDNGERWMNATELFVRARADEHFQGLNENQVFNSVAYFYKRWEGPAQHKIHASPIAPTLGENVDHQTSLRTPNLSGQSRDEIVLLGLEVISGWAVRDDLAWDKAEMASLRLRAWQDNGFIDSFLEKIKNTNPKLKNTDFDLTNLYEQIKEKGLSGVFPPLGATHPVMIVHNARQQGMSPS